jgi:hypothetical protein
LELNVERSADSSGEDGGRKFGSTPCVRISRVHSSKADRDRYTPLELTDVRENARLVPLAYKQTFSDLSNVDWKFCRIEYIV